MKMKRIIIVVIALALSGCSNEEWEGFVYPDKNDLTEHINIGIYKSLEECRASAINMLNRTSSVSAGDYECGLNCELGRDMGGIKICEETVR